jgi:hypothetical protein
MTELVLSPLFPLSIFPLPGELVPLHIFEPRYRQLLADAETRDISFGIYFNHVSNVNKLGSLVKLESVIKRYAGGESDIIVKCHDLLRLKTLYRNYRDKLYPGADVHLMEVDMVTPVMPPLVERFQHYMQLMSVTYSHKQVSAYHIANEMNMDLEAKLRFANLPTERQEHFLMSQLNYQVQILEKTEMSRDVFHLN